jgi:hypothetical protein
VGIKISQDHPIFTSITEGNSTLNMETAHSFEKVAFIYPIMPGKEADTMGNHKKPRPTSLKT